MYVCVYVCTVMYKAISVCMYCMYVCDSCRRGEGEPGHQRAVCRRRLPAHAGEFADVCMYVCMYDVCMYVCMYV